VFGSKLGKGHAKQQTHVEAPHVETLNPKPGVGN